ncbi:MAG: ABC transporter permease [Phycisphaerae bacterium]|nr:ABC transporter permease [Phycisphaerae bacterium]
MSTAAKDFVETAAGRSLWSDAFRRLRQDKAAVACFIIICLYAAVATVAPFAFGDWEESYDYDNTNAAPSLERPLGTDALGRPVLQKTLLGANVSMTVAFMSNIVAVPLGMIFGVIAGYYGKWIDDVIVWLYTTLASIPGIILLFALRFAFMGKSLFAETFFEIDLGGMAGLCIALGVTFWIGTCRLVRAETMKLRELDYVLAARATGRRSLVILLKHIIPNVFHIGIIRFSLGFVGAILLEVMLSYLNLGVPDKPSWGKMISAARMDLIVGRWWEIAAAVGATFIIVLAWNIFGDRLRDALDPRLKNA